MRVLFVADGRSPIALNWISYFVEKGHEVMLASTHPCHPSLSLASFRVLPLPLSSEGNQSGLRALEARRWIPVTMRTRLRQWLVPLSLSRVAQPLTEMITHFKPDLVHAMRIPYEGMLAALANPPMPLLISVWGNDFTLHARATPLMHRFTRMAVRRADALHSDCQRDQRLARQWGFPEERPSVVLPGNGGVQLRVFYPQEKASNQPLTVINPRGVRAYVRNDTFFNAIPQVLQRQPEAHFFCPGMRSELQVEKWVRELSISRSVDLLPHQIRPEMAKLFRQAHMVTSITTHDGTPNTLLEAMASGCYPIAGDIETSTEWIKSGENGTLVDPADPQALATAILDAWGNRNLMDQAAKINRSLIEQRANYHQVMPAAEKFYVGLVH